MTNFLAVLLAIILICAIVADIFLNSGEALVFLAKRLDALIEWIAFWR